VAGVFESSSEILFEFCDLVFVVFFSGAAGGVYISSRIEWGEIET